MLTAGPADGNVIVAENARPPIDGGTVLITGASAGIGREFALQLAPRARMLILLARRAGRLDELRTSLLARHAQLRVLPLSVDLSDESDVDRLKANERKYSYLPRLDKPERGPPPWNRRGRSRSCRADPVAAAGQFSGSGTKIVNW